MRAVSRRRSRRMKMVPARSAIHPAAGQSRTSLFAMKRVGRTEEIVDTLTWAKDCGASTVAITNGGEGSPLAQAAHLALCTERTLESIGARFGPHVNAYTSFDETVYMLDVPTDRPGYVDRGLLALHDFASGMSLQAEEIEKERGVVIEEIGMRQDQPWTKVFNSVNHMM